MKLPWPYRRGSQSLKCHHEWPPWGKPYAAGYTPFQRRQCTACGEVQTRQCGPHLSTTSEEDLAELGIFRKRS